ncbi:MAG TPA: ADP-ribosylglycohydrolase family protein [Thermoanaerobaculia bacterium]|jgi:ADP-ribosylglycohydrolase|nr:ADP-ribosylglycohydrolase family protein [Thermoanaerobaculia bacterium]
MPTPRTSLTHPLRIDSVPAARGRIGLTFCPGKCQLHAATGAWERDLGLDLDAIADWGAAALVTLVEDGELRELQVPRDALAEGAARRHVAWLHLPIADAGVPDAAFERRWERAGMWLRELLRRGRGVVVHCKGGLGRTGMIAARLLVELGEAPEEAIARVRRARPNAIETREQEEHVRRCHAVAVPEYPARVRGCLLGGAMGDALGAGVELDSLAEIRRRFGPRGAVGYVGAYGRPVAITDDTQMTLFTAEGLIRAAVRGRVGGGRGLGVVDAVGMVWHAYDRWLLTQGEALEPLAARWRARGAAQTGAAPTGAAQAQGEWAWPDGWLVAEPRLHDARGPGNTCLAALRGGRMGTREEPINDSKGCGGVMRAAPAGLLRRPAGEAFALGADLAAITHGHPSGYLAAGCLAAMVARLVDGASLGEAVATARRELAGQEGAAEVEGRLDAAVAAARRAAEEDAPSPEAIESLGAGWVGEEALAIAVYCALVGERWGEQAGEDGAASAVRPALLLAVNHSGDSDSTGAITGNLLGARFGVEALPAGLLEELELRDVIERMADDLVREVLGLAAGDAGWSERYPGW